LRRKVEVPGHAEVSGYAKAKLRQGNLADAVTSLNHLAFQSRRIGRKMLRKEPGYRNAGLGIGSNADRRQRLLGQERSAGRGREQPKVGRGARQRPIVERPPEEPSRCALK
jgi:hypothetical protein